MRFIFLAITLLTSFSLFSQAIIEEGDPLNKKDIPGFFKSKLSDIENEIQKVKKGEVEIIATSPGGLPVYAVYYGEKENILQSANYNSAIGAKNPAFYAKKDSSTKPVLFFIGPVHGQEVENIAGLINLIHVAETGKDYRGKPWPKLVEKINKSRTIIVPCGNPDGRKRCPYNSFLGLPTSTMTKYGQGTRKDDSFYGWPGAKSIHPMKGDVKILGAYFNDDGINMMHDDFFDPMANETKAILEIAKTEAPDITVSLHSHEHPPLILQPAHVGMFMKEKTHNLALRVNRRYQNAGIWCPDEKNFWKPRIDDEKAPANSFNLISALHHISGTMAFTFECCHGSNSDRFPETMVSYSDIVDIQLLLYDEMYNYILENKTIWKQN